MRLNAAILSALLCLTLVGCSSPAPAPEQASAGAGMGMGASSEGGGGMLSGAIADSKNASLTVLPSASTHLGITVSRVLAPVDGWVVVRSTASPGVVLGKVWVPKGASADVPIKLTAADTADVRVALHVDRGARNAFEYDPSRPEYSLDKPVVAGGSAVEARVALVSYGAEVMANSVLMLVEDQTVARDTITVRYLLLPTTGWISVNEVENDLPGRQVGLAYRPAGESQQVLVPVQGATPGEYVVTALADRGMPGSFEFAWTNPLGSADQPFKSAGVIVSQRIRLD